MRLPITPRASNPPTNSICVAGSGVWYVRLSNPKSVTAPLNESTPLKNVIVAPVTGAPVTGATITFFNGVDSFNGAVTDFGLDNLTYQTPEPATQMLFVGGLLALGVIGRRKILGLFAAQ